MHTLTLLHNTKRKKNRHTLLYHAHTDRMNETPPQMTPEFAQQLAAAQSSIYAFIITLMGGSDEAADVLQETNLKLCRAFYHYDVKKPFINWALTLARFEVMAWRSRQSRSRLILDNDVAEKVADAMEKMSIESERQLAALERCLQKLPQHQRNLIEERYQQGKTVREMAGLKGEPENALAAMLYRIRRILQECITTTLAKEESA